jgi:hypothetical protein
VNYIPQQIVADLILSIDCGHCIIDVAHDRINRHLMAALTCHYLELAT